MAQSYKQKNVLNAFSRVGFKVIRQSKHIIMQCHATGKTIALPRHSEINALIVRRLARENNLELSNFLELLK